MSDTIKKILVVDDEKKFLNSIAERLKILGFDPLKATSGLEALELAKSTPFDLAIVDLKMPGIDGLVTIAKLKEIQPNLKSILLTGHGSDKVKEATDAINSAYFEKDHMRDFWDFIKKSSMDGNTIVITPPSHRAHATSQAENRSDGRQPGQSEVIADDVSSHPPGEIFRATVDDDDQPQPAGQLRMIGETQGLQILRRNIARVAALDCPIIIRGETGTGKELAARIIHNSSPRRKNRFIAFNCGCLSSDLLIEELFRSSRNVSASGTDTHDYGLTSDSGGTLLLDQIEDMSMKMQLSMLKLLDNKEAYRKKKQAYFPFDVRILVAGRHNLRKLVEEGKFREELFHRLSVMELFIPPLRERREDILPLSGFFLNKFAKEFKKPVKSISDEVISVFMAYDFPGNVRELEHVIERGVILTDGSEIELNHLPTRFKPHGSSTLTDDFKILTLAEVEKNHIFKVLQVTGGKKSKASELLGISRSALWRKLSIISKKEAKEN